jgi:hypothetical protein
MCVCAGSTGAVMVPVAHKVRAAIKPRPAIHSAPVHSSGIAAVPCAAVPQIAAGDGLPNLSPSGFGVPENSIALAPVQFAGGGGGIGAIGGGTGGIGGIGGALPPPLNPGTFLPSPPVTGSVPETTTWSMMIVGAGAVGGTIRWRRREQSV